MSQVVAQSAELSDRQRAVLRATVRAYVGDASPVGSATLSQLLPTRLSSASIRATLAELAELGLVDQPHTSAGRVPTQLGLRVFIDALLDPRDVAEYDRRAMAWDVEEAEGEAVPRVASQLLTDRTHLLGFVVTPRLEDLPLCHVSLVRLSRERLLAVLVSQDGAAHRKVVEYDEELAQSDLDRIAVLLNERVAGRTLPQVRDGLAREARALRRKAHRLRKLAIELGMKALAADEVEQGDLVIGTRLALFDQPEFQDPRSLRDLLEALETKERVLEVLEQMLDDREVRVVLGGETDDPALQQCALVATSYGGDGAGSGTLGVIGPARMDYGRVIPLVDCLSRIVSEKLGS